MPLFLSRCAKHAGGVHIKDVHCSTRNSWATFQPILNLNSLPKPGVSGPTPSSTVLIELSPSPPLPGHLWCRHKARMDLWVWPLNLPVLVCCGVSVTWPTESGSCFVSKLITTALFSAYLIPLFSDKIFFFCLKFLSSKALLKITSSAQNFRINFCKFPSSELFSSLSKIFFCFLWASVYLYNKIY